MPEECTQPGCQRFELAMHCVEVEEPDNITEKFANLIRFAAIEGLDLDMFSKRDQEGNHLLHEVTAVGILRPPEDFPPDSLGGRALTAAGIITHSGNEDPEGTP